MIPRGTTSSGVRQPEPRSAYETPTTAPPTTPASLRITARGGPVELAIQGSALERVRSVEVQLNGKAVGSVSVRTLRGTATDLTLVLQAAAGATTGEGLRVVLVTHRTRVEVPSHITL